MADSLEWCAGLFIGEGHAGTIGGHKPHNRLCLRFIIGMCDEAAIARMAKAIEPLIPERKKAWKHLQGVRYTVSVPSNPRWQPSYRIALTSGPAEAVLRALYPYMKGTDKGNQTEAAFEACGLDIHDPSVRPEPMPRNISRRASNE